VLSIYGKVDWDVPDKLKLLHGEYGIGDYQRVFTLSGEVNREKIEATVNNGVLKVILPKAEAAKTKKIAVRAETK
jgi:HSP20 family protein